MGHTFPNAQSQRRQRLASLQCLAWCLLVSTEQDRVIRCSPLQTHNVLHLIHNAGVGGDLATAVAMGLQAQQL